MDFITYHYLWYEIYVLYQNPTTGEIVDAKVITEVIRFGSDDFDLPD